MVQGIGKRTVLSRSGPASRFPEMSGTPFSINPPGQSLRSLDTKTHCTCMAGLRETCTHVAA